MPILIQFYNSPRAQIFPIHAPQRQGWGYFCPGMYSALNSSASLMDAQDSQAESNHQQNKSNYQLDEADTNSGGENHPHPGDNCLQDDTPTNTTCPQTPSLK